MTLPNTWRDNAKRSECANSRERERTVSNTPLSRPPSQGFVVVVNENALSLDLDDLVHSSSLDLVRSNLDHSRRKHVGEGDRVYFVRDGRLLERILDDSCPKE